MSDQAKSLDNSPLSGTGRENTISVIVPLYKGARFIKTTLESILNQTYPASEVIVVDDESPDNSAEIVRSFGESVELIRIKNSGASAARNFGAQRAKSEWLAFCDQDDIWLPTKLADQIQLVSECPEVHLVLSDYSEVVNGVVSNRSHFSYAPQDFWAKEQHRYGFIVREAITGKLSRFQPSITSTPIVRRDFFLKSGGFDNAVEWGAEDTCFHFRCLSVVPFGVIPKVLMHYNRHPDAGSADPVKQMRKTVAVWEYIIENYPEAIPYKNQLRIGVAALRDELAQSERYARRQKIKRFLGLK